MSDAIAKIIFDALDTAGDTESSGVPYTYNAFADDLKIGVDGEVDCKKFAVTLTKAFEAAGFVIVEGWQPIETAPKDAVLLAFDHKTGIKFCRWDSWGDGTGHWEHEGKDGEGYMAWLWNDPTHWMPLPSPPQEPKP